MKASLLLVIILALSGCTRQKNAVVIVNNQQELKLACQELRGDNSLSEQLAKILSTEKELLKNVDNQEYLSDLKTTQNLVRRLQELHQHLKLALKPELVEPIYNGVLSWEIKFSELVGLNKSGKITSASVQEYYNGARKSELDDLNLSTVISDSKVLITFKKMFSALELCDLNHLNGLTLDLHYEVSDSEDSFFSQGVQKFWLNL